MTSKLTRERIELIANFHRAMTLPPSHDEIEELARMAMVAMDSEPVAYMYRQVQELRNRFGTCDEWEINCRLVESDFPAVEIPESEDYEFLPLYRHAQPAQVVPDAYVRDEHGRMMLNGVCEPKIGFGTGWNACRAAMLSGGKS